MTPETGYYTARREVLELGVGEVLTGGIMLIKRAYWSLCKLSHTGLTTHLSPNVSIQTDSNLE